MKQRTQDDKPRRVGVEIEFAGLDPEQAARLLARCFGGQCRQSDLYRWQISDTEFGDFETELDTQFVHKDGTPVAVKLERDHAEFSRDMRKMIGAVAEALVPTEVVAPPIAFDDLPRLDMLVDALREAGAADSRDNPFYAFGVHLNPEFVAPTVDYLLPVLQAYMLLSPWLRAQIDVDFSRRVLPHIDPFPQSYVDRLIDAAYRPNLAGLIDDYLAENATRNRELDMLPGFAALDEARVRAVIDDPRIKPRPTFHYRLPETRLSDPDWSIMTEWRRWCLVEDLAEDHARLHEFCAAYRQHRADWLAWLAPAIDDWRGFKAT